VEVQRRFGEMGPTVAEGRDIGTVVFPKAKCKIYLDASLEERTQRRATELRAKGLDVDLDALRAEIHQRDEGSRNRKDSPLRPAEDAVIMDTTAMSFEEVVDAMLLLAKEKL
jgi:cytidylate kinase